MEKDPDYLDPDVIKRRASKTAGLEVKPGRPQLRRPKGEGRTADTKTDTKTGRPARIAR